MDDIGRTHARILASLWELDGSAWQEVQSEIHETYKELPFWILLKADVPPIKLTNISGALQNPNW